MVVRGRVAVVVVNDLLRKLARLVVIDIDQCGNAVAFVVEGTGGFADSGVAPDIDKTLSGIPAGRTIIVLAHNPSLFEALAERGVALTLSGHTPWGQLALPAASWSLAGMFLEDAMGVNTRGRSLPYISPGTG